jgi:hypothetical protein
VYLFKPISNDVRLFQEIINHQPRTMNLMLVSILACMAALLQSAGGFFPGIGYLISPLATAPILLCSIFSIPSGVMSYVLTNSLLLILQPTELIIFPFTTGLLGLGIGAAFLLFKIRISMIAAGSVLLTLGIITLLYIFQFPVLGPIVSNSFSFLTTGIIFLFTFFYSWLWVELALIIVKRLSQILSLRRH